MQQDRPEQARMRMVRIFSQMYPQVAWHPPGFVSFRPVSAFSAVAAPDSGNPSGIGSNLAFLTSQTDLFLYKHWQRGLLGKPGRQLHRCEKRRSELENAKLGFCSG